MKLKQNVVKALKALGVEEMARDLYYKTLGSRIPRQVVISGAAYRFFVPTPHLADGLLGMPEEQKVQDWLFPMLQEGDCVWDVGANIGLWAAAFAGRVGRRGRVVAFEPDPLVNRYLRRNMATNGLDQVVIFPFALSDQSGSGLLYTGVDDLSLGSLKPREDGLIVHEKGTPVELRDGASMVREGLARPPHAIKIDAEGAEYAILRGLGPEALSECRALMVEVHPLLLPGFGCDVGALENWLASNGFVIAMKEYRTTIELWACERASRS